MGAGFQSLQIAGRAALPEGTGVHSFLMMRVPIPSLPRYIVALLVGAFGILALPADGAAQRGVLRGVVTDSTGAPLRGVEVFAIQTDRSTRTDAQGRYSLTRLPWGQSVVMARTLGYRPVERAVNIGDDGEAELNFSLSRAIQLVDTLRITSHDGCAAYRYEGFDCRRRAGIGQFRGPEELRALRPDYWSDIFEGLNGFRKVPFTDHERGRLDWTVESVTGWRCLIQAFNGREPTARETTIRVQDIYAIEHFDVYDRVPEPYKRLAWPPESRTPCTLVMFWTRDFIEENRDK